MIATPITIPNASLFLAKVREYRQLPAELHAQEKDRVVIAIQRSTNRKEINYLTMLNAALIATKKEL